MFSLSDCDSIDCSPPGSSVHGIFQARILERAAFFFSRGSSWSKDWTWVSCVAARVFIKQWESWVSWICTNLVNAAKLFSKDLVPSYSPVSTVLVVPCSCQYLIFFIIFITVILVVNLVVLLIFIFLITNEEHVYTFLLFIWMFSYVNIGLNPHLFFIRLPIFFLLISASSLYVLDMNPLSVMYIINGIFHSMSWLYI